MIVKYYDDMKNLVAEHALPRGPVWVKGDTVSLSQVDRSGGTAEIDEYVCSVVDKRSKTVIMKKQ